MHVVFDGCSSSLEYELQESRNLTCIIHHSALRAKPSAWHASHPVSSTSILHLKHILSLPISTVTILVQATIIIIFWTNAINFY